MATKLKSLKIKKVDFVDEGANPEAHIMLHKSKDGVEQSEEGNSEKRSGFFKKLLAMIAKAATMDQSEFDSAMEEIQKGDAVSFKEKFNEAKNRKIADEIWDICYALQSSLCSILNDEELDGTSASTAMLESLEEFHTVVQDSIKQWSEGKEASIVSKSEDVTEVELEVMKSAVSRLTATIEKATVAKEGPENIIENPKGDEEMKIDKSKMTPAERAFFEDLEKRYGTEDATAPAVATPVVPATEENPVAKSATPAPAAPVVENNGEGEDIYKGLHPAVKAELESLKKYREASEDKELQAVAKRYAIIGKKEEELVPVLKSLKAAGGTAYDDMIAVLDQAVATVEKSGVFTEIGKSGHGSNVEGGAWAEAEVKAVELMKSRAGLSKSQALDEVLQADPALAKRCEEEE